jgi:hypothetical protein
MISIKKSLQKIESRANAGGLLLETIIDKGSRPLVGPALLSPPAHRFKFTPNGDVVEDKYAKFCNAGGVVGHAGKGLVKISTYALSVVTVPLSLVKGCIDPTPGGMRISHLAQAKKGVKVARDFVAATLGVGVGILMFGLRLSVTVTSLLAAAVGLLGGGLFGAVEAMFDAMSRRDGSKDPSKSADASNLPAL